MHPGIWNIRYIFFCCLVHLRHPDNLHDFHVTCPSFPLYSQPFLPCSQPVVFFVFSAKQFCYTVCLPSKHQTHTKTITYHTFKDTGDLFDKTTSLPQGYVRANAYHNYVSKSGHAKGLYYELNLYTPDGQSKHHTTRVKGIHFGRDDSHDQNYGTTKGRHWRDR